MKKKNDTLRVQKPECCERNQKPEYRNQGAGEPEYRNQGDMRETSDRRESREVPSEARGAKARENQSTETRAQGKKKIIHTPAKGLTFVELLIVTALLAVIALALYAVFASGVKIWVAVNRSIPEEELNIFLYKLGSDLRNSFNYKGIDFLGEEDSLEFPAIVDSRRLEKKTIGQVAYSYKPTQEIVIREERDFSHIYAEDEGDITQAVSGVESLTFQYRYYNKEKKEYMWLDEWERKELPVAVKIELEFNDGSEISKITKTIDIPCSGSL